MKNGKVLNRIFFLAWSLIKLHVVQSPPCMAASWAILGVTARMILCSAVPSKCFFRCGHLRTHCRTPHSCSPISPLVGKWLAFLIQSLHPVGQANAPNTSAVAVATPKLDTYFPMLNARNVVAAKSLTMHVPQSYAADPPQHGTTFAAHVCDGAGGTDNHQGTLICSS